MEAHPFGARPCLAGSARWRTSSYVFNLLSFAFAFICHPELVSGSHKSRETVRFPHLSDFSFNLLQLIPFLRERKNLKQKD